MRTILLWPCPLWCFVWHDRIDTKNLWLRKWNTLIFWRTWILNCLAVTHHLLNDKYKNYALYRGSQMSIGLILNLLKKLNKSILCVPLASIIHMYYFIQQVQLRIENIFGFPANPHIQTNFCSLNFVGLLKFMLNC